MKTSFIPIDYDYFDFKGRNYAKIVGRDEKGKKVCIIDECDVYFWAILRDGLSEQKTKKLIEKISKIRLDLKGRKTKVEKIELLNKNFMGKSVKALKIYATNYKDLHNIADHLGLDEIEKRRGYDLGYVTHYINESKLNPLTWHEVEGEILNNSEEYGGIDMALDVELCIKLQKHRLLDKKDFSPNIMAYDIETTELKIGEGEILMVSLVSKNFQKVITWKKTTKNKPSYVEYVKDEGELIEKFVQHIKEQKPDILVGYNSDGFDLPYIKARAENYNIKLNLGVDGSQPKFTRGVVLSGKISGIVHVDILKFIRTTYSQYMQSETLSLNEVAKEFLGNEKKDFNAHNLPSGEKIDW